MGNKLNPAARPICVRRLDLASLILEVTELYADTFRQQHIDLDLDVPQNLWVEVDPILMREAFRKLVDNSVDAMPNGGTLTVTSLVGRHGLEIEFADSGCGTSDELKERMFEPRSSTKHDRAGLGLTMVRDIAQSHQGSVLVDDCPEGGTALTLLIPVQRATRQAA